ncbi:MAG: DUF1080 domain-containing protein [Chitinophagaceae bacterium]
MQKLLIVLIVGTLLSCSSSKQAAGGIAMNVLSSAEKQNGWQLLFDGTTKNGWHVYNNRSDGSAWKVADGTLYLDRDAKQKGAGGGDIATDGEYSNFHLKLEWKIDTGGNSGIIFLVKEDQKYRYSFVTGPEMQIVDNDRHPDAKINEHRASDLYDLVAAVPDAGKTTEQWNLAEVIVNNGKLDLLFNGKTVVSTMLWDENWKKLVANSKFKNVAEFASFREGKIALQDHGDNVWFRNIKIKKL